MKLHWSPRSPFVRKVMVVVHELGLADRIACVRTVAATTKPHADLMQDNPLSKIPTLVLDDGTVIYDSPVICEYLDSLDGAPKLHPAEPKARLVALRRQALGDGFLDMLVLLRDERMRAHPSDVHKASAAVRKAAVLSLTRWAGEPAARDALGIALKDSDADVRAYARRALERGDR